MLCTLFLENYFESEKIVSDLDSSLKNDVAIWSRNPRQHSPRLQIPAPTHRRGPVGCVVALDLGQSDRFGWFIGILPAQTRQN